MKNSKAGFSLIELLVSIGVSLFITVAAVSLSASQAQFFSVSTRRVEMYQSSRTVMDILTQDIRNAGVGVGYSGDGRFGGLIRGTDIENLPGGPDLKADDRIISLSSGPLPTDDLGIRLTTGQIRTIAAYTNNAGQICTGHGLSPNDIVVLMTGDGMSARTAEIVSVNPPAGCTEGECVGGCANFTVNSDSNYASGADAAQANYAEGMIAGGFEQVVWYVMPVAGRGSLVRANIDNGNPCAPADQADLNCGNVMTDNVEVMQIRVLQWDAGTSSWVDRTTAPQLDDPGRLRLDIELVTRVSGDPASGRQDPVQLSWTPNATCLPGPDCVTPPDTVVRHVARTSVDLRNSGRLRMN